MIALVITLTMFSLFFYVNLQKIRRGFVMFPFECPQQGNIPCQPIGLKIPYYNFFIIFIPVLALQTTIFKCFSKK